MLAAKTRQAQLKRIEAMAARLPETVSDSRTGQHTHWAVRGKKFAYYLVDHHGDGRVTFDCKAEKGVNALLVAAEPDRFFLPKYMAQHGWVGQYVDAGPVDWDEIEAMLVDAYRLTAPKTLARQV